jgi:hypothetical protein
LQTILETEEIVERLKKIFLLVKREVEVLKTAGEMPVPISSSK